MFKVKAINPNLQISLVDKNDAIIKKHGTKYTKQVLKQYRRTVKDWKTKVKFEIKTSGVVSDKTEFEVFTTNLIYKFVHDGTKAHRIEPKRKPALIYQESYKRKTTFGKIPSRKGGSSGPYTTNYIGVDHPGFAGDDKTKLIIAKTAPKFYSDLEKAIDKIKL